MATNPRGRPMARSPRNASAAARGQNAVSGHRAAAENMPFPRSLERVIRQKSRHFVGSTSIDAGMSISRANSRHAPIDPQRTLDPPLDGIFPAESPWFVGGLPSSLPALGGSP